MGNHLSTRAGSNRKTLGKLEVAREKPGTVDFNPLSWKCSSSAPLFFFFLFLSQSYPIFPGWFSSFSTARRICHLIRRQLLCISDCIFFAFRHALCICFANTLGVTWCLWRWGIVYGTKTNRTSIDFILFTQNTQHAVQFSLRSD